MLVFGNGHVGRALVQVLAILPAQVRWIDSREGDFPANVPVNARIVATDSPEDEIDNAPAGAFVVVATHSHPLDFALIERALARIGTPYEDYWDVYLIRYRDGSHIPPHTDDAQHGRRHRRLNALLERATAGGELTIAGARIELAIGDAVLFEPDREVHDVARVVGSRLLFSVGAWV